MICPNCGNMMDEVLIGEVRVDYCRSGCKGVFFDNYELYKMDEKHEYADDPVLQEILSHERDSSNDARGNELMCPRCNIRMRKQAYSYGTGIYLDRCYGCNGIFLDKGELAAIRDNFRDSKTREKIVENIMISTPGTGLAGGNAGVDEELNDGFDSNENKIRKGNSIIANFFSNIFKK